MNANSATKPGMMPIKSLATTVLWAFSNLVVQRSSPSSGSGYRAPMAVGATDAAKTKAVDMMDNADALTTCPQPTAADTVSHSVIEKDQARSLSTNNPLQGVPLRVPCSIRACGEAQSCLCNPVLDLIAPPLYGGQHLVRTAQVIINPTKIDTVALGNLFRARQWTRAQT